MAAGKWRGMMDIAPAKLPVYATPAFPTWSDSGDKSCAIAGEDGTFYEGGSAAPSLPEFHRELAQQRFIDIFSKSPDATTQWNASANQPWVHVSQNSGTIAAGVSEQRIEVSVDKTAPAGGSAKLTIRCANTDHDLPISIRIAPDNAAENASFIESDRIVSIYATHSDSRTDGWEVLNGLGHTGASLRSDLDLHSTDTVAGKLPSATYRFATTTVDDKATLNVIALPVLPVTSENGMRVAVSIDGGAPQILDLKAAEFSQEWRRNVLTNSAIGEIDNLRLASGAHTLKVFALDPGVILDRFEIDFAGAEHAYLPVSETRIAR
jgi:hypothetical protein